MKNRLALAITSFLLVTAAHAGITVTSPANGATTATSVRFKAAASMSYPVTSMKIYVDGSSKYQTAASVVDATLTLATGTRSVTVKAWDTKGNVSSQSLAVNVMDYGVAVSSPANGATTGTSVNVVATAMMANPVRAMKIYVDGVSKYQVAAASLNTTLTVAAGTRRITVKAWDGSGSVASQQITVNAVASSAVVDVPETAAAFYNIDELDGWGHCTLCAGGGEQALYTMKQGVASPSIDGKSMEFWVGGTVPYSHGLWWKRLDSTDSTKSHFVLEMRYYIKEPQKSFGLEFAVNQAFGGKRWKWSTQCSYNKGYFSTWDTYNFRWVATSVPCTRPKAYTWQHVVFEYARVNGKARFISITVDGQKHYVNKEFEPEAFPDNGMNVHFQLNGNSFQDDYSVWMDKMNLRYW